MRFQEMVKRCIEVFLLRPDLVKQCTVLFVFSLNHNVIPILQPFLSEHFSTKHLTIARTSAQLASALCCSPPVNWKGCAKIPFDASRLLRLGLNHLNPWILVYQETSHIRDVWQAIWDIPIFVNGHDLLVVNQLYELMFCYLTPYMFLWCQAIHVATPSATATHRNDVQMSFRSLMQFR